VDGNGRAYINVVVAKMALRGGEGGDSTKKFYINVRLKWINEFVDLETPFLFPWYHPCFCEENPQKLLPPELLFLAQICTKSFVGWGFAPDLTGRAYSAPPDPVAVFRGPTSKGKSREKGGERREGEGRGGSDGESSFFALRRKKKSRRLCPYFYFWGPHIYREQKLR